MKKYTADGRQTCTRHYCQMRLNQNAFYIFWFVTWLSKNESHLVMEGCTDEKFKTKHKLSYKT